MTESTEQLALSLLHADSESEVIGILREHDLWDEPKNWRLYGDRDGNFSVIGNQQSRPEAALVEKIVNSVDARLMKECLAKGIEPNSAEAPQSVRQAVATLIEGVEVVGEKDGHVRFWPSDRQLEQSRHITLAVTGSKPRQEGGTSITITDCGEGQTPTKMRDTFLSIDRENKLRIPFVQGKFNMGGTGALKFCGREGLQLIITRRFPDILGHMDGEDAAWGFTIVRRVRPTDGIGQVRNSVYRYLAPDGANENPERGDVLRFVASSINAAPNGKAAYARPLHWGSVLKLYEYDMKRFGSHALMPDGILGRLELMLPGIALPVRVHECRAYKGVAGSFDTTLVGLAARLEANRGKNLEKGFPTSVSARIAGEDLAVEIYAFKPDKAGAYRSTEGIIFTINGQTHATLPKSFFSRKNVKMGRLGESLLVVVDCSRLSVAAREDLFMNSRDRLSNGELRKEIEEELEDLVGRHHGLKDLRERRRKSEIAQRLGDSKPLEDALGTILRASPSLNRLFVLGQRLSRPHRASHKGGSDNGTGRGGGAFVGKLHPTFFRFEKIPDADSIHRSAENGRRCRIKFETDVANDYFQRASVPGRYFVEVLEGPTEELDVSHNLILHDGVANWSISLPDEINVGDKLKVQCTVTDDTLIEPFVKIAEISVSPRTTTRSGTGTRDRRPDTDTPTNGKGAPGGKGKNKDAGIQLPKIQRVKENDPLWREHRFDPLTGCKVVDDSDPSQPENGAELTFYVNTSNRSFETDLKSSREDPKVAEAKFVYANVLVGLGILHDSQDGHQDASGETESPEDRVASTTKALAPFLLPMIEYLGSLGPDEISGGGVGDDD